MYSRRALTLSVVTAAGLAISACSSLPESDLPVPGGGASGQLDIAVSGSEDSVLEMPFEAHGNEPFWHATVEDGELFLTRPYEDERTRRFPVELKAASRQGREYVATLDDLPISLMVAHQLCQDSMSGAQYPARVRLVVGGEEFTGCGGKRERLFRGEVWVVEDLGGTGIIDSSRITIEFLEDNRLAGRASCNRYTGSYQLGGEGIVIGPVVTTRMACAPALMNQENRFLSLLDQVTSVRIGQHGELLLSTPQGSTIRAFQSDHDSP